LAATIHTPKAISPTETKYERAVSMASRLRFFLRPSGRMIIRWRGPNLQEPIRTVDPLDEG
jgi:hypothetical protein